MTKIICAAVECKYNSDENVCTAKTITLGENFVHTVHQGQRQFWGCHRFEQSEDYQNFLERAKGCFAV